MRAKLLRVWTALGLLTVELSCGVPEARTPKEVAELQRLREVAGDQPDKLGELLLSELLAPGGDAKRAAEARKALDAARGDSMLDHLARALDETFHGRLAQAPESYLKAAAAARISTDPNADLVAWFACEQAVTLAANTQGLFARWRPWVETSLADPQHLGWRARDALVGWWASEAWSAAQKDVEQTHAEKSGCLAKVRLAGPFGVNAAADALRTFSAESDNPWPTSWKTDPWSGTAPRVVTTEQRGCDVAATEASKAGIFYAEGFFGVAEETKAIVTVSNALEIWVDGVPVLERDVRAWSAWTHVGSGVVLPAGAHRVVAKLTSAETSLRVLTADGRPLPLKVLAPEQYAQPLLPRANAFAADALGRFISEKGVGEPPSVWIRFAAALLAHVDHETEAGILLLEPLVTPADATGPALGSAALLAVGDPLHSEDETKDIVRDFHARALKRDAALWESELSRVSLLARNSGLVEGVRELRALTERFPQVPALLSALIDAYEELGWMPEYGAAVKRRSELFPEEAAALTATADLLEHRGETGAAQALLTRVRQRNPDSDVFVTRALEAKDFRRAADELRLLQKRRPQNKALAARLQDVLLSDGGVNDNISLLRNHVERSPKDGKARLALADAEFAGGKLNALPLELADAVKDGANLGPLKSAIDLVENMTELERYRLDTREVIDAYEKSPTQLSGNAARVLDYLAVWVHADGSSRMLEHEIVGIQSEEAIKQFAEQEFGEELILKARVIKKDGRVLEPQMVKGKPTVTFPHLQVGDYVETERVLFKRAEAGGTAFDGPHWFFREKDVAYARSELVVVVPKERSVEIAAAGGAPDPEITDNGYFRAYHWRVDGSPAAPVEPLSVPVQEFLPQVTVNWGLSLERRLRMLANNTADLTPVDPRIVRIAQAIPGVSQAKAELDRAKAIYRWVLSEVREGEESDGRRAVVGRSGNRWRAFTALCRAVGVKYQWAVARSRLSPEPRSAVQAATQFAQTVLRVGSGPFAWVDLGDRYAPFGYLPAGNRGVEAYLLELSGGTKAVTPNDGARDALEINAQIALGEDGAADVILEQQFVGKYGSLLRKGLSELEQRRLKDAIETRVLGASLRGAQLLDYEIVDADKFDRALRIKMNANVPHFAVKQQKRLVISPPFSPRLGQFVGLSTRQTPMLLATDQDFGVSMRIVLPTGSRVEGLESYKQELGEYSVKVSDSLERGVLTLSRSVRIPAGRVSPAAYPDFQRFMLAADAALNRDIVVHLP